MKRDLINYFKTTREQRNNQKIIIHELWLIVGAIFLSEGIISLFPPSFNKNSLIVLGLILIIFAVLSNKKESE